MIAEEKIKENANHQGRGLISTSTNVQFYFNSSHSLDYIRSSNATFLPFIHFIIFLHTSIHSIVRKHKILNFRYTVYFPSVSYQRSYNLRTRRYTTVRKKKTREEKRNGKREIEKETRRKRSSKIETQFRRPKSGWRVSSDNRAGKKKEDL